MICNWSVCPYLNEDKKPSILDSMNVARIVSKWYNNKLGLLLLFEKKMYGVQSRQNKSIPTLQPYIYNKHI